MKERIEATDLALLFDVSRASNEGSEDAYLRHILEGCVRWFSASGVSVFIRRQRSDTFALAAKLGADTRVPASAQLRTGEGIAGAAIASGQPMLLQHPSDNPLLVGKVQPRNDIGSAMVIPLITPESGCIGVLNVSRRIGENAFSKADLAQASTLARHLAMAVSNARLFAALNSAVAEAREAHEKLDAIIQCLGVGVVVTDGAGAVERWNPEAERILGKPLSEHCQLSLATVKCAPELKTCIAKGLKKAQAGKRLLDRAHQSEAEKAWSVASSPLPGGGAAIAIQDISNHERALKDLSRVRRLAEIGQMTAAIAHEIRNPLTGIRSAAQMIQGSDTEAAEFGRIIETEALKLNALCDEFLDFARPLSLHVERIDIGHVLRNVCREYEDTARKSGVRLSLNIDQPLGRTRADLVRFEQICRNLIMNAIQACDRGGAVRVSLHQDRMIVDDEGKGIDDTSVQKLFTPFFTTKSNGTGLGLSNVRKIVDAHGWEIKVHSQLDKGTRFEILFPEAKAA